MEPIDNCSICNGRRVVESDEGMEPCECMKKYKIKKYLSEIGSNITLPKKEIINTIEDYNLEGNLYINLPKKIPIGELNGIIAYIMKNKYPKEFILKNVFEVYIEMRDNKTFSQIFSFNAPTMVITAGLPEEHIGYNYETGEEWTTEAFGNIIEQIFGYRLRKGLSNIYVALDDPYPKARHFADTNEFQFIDLLRHVPDSDVNKFM